MWIRGTLSDDFGIRSQDVEWCVGGYNTPEPQYAHRIPLRLAEAGIKVTTIPSTESIDAMLQGESSPPLCRAFPGHSGTGRPPSRGSSRILERRGRLLHPTGIFPIMHLVVVKRELYENHPWVAVSLYKAFEQARRIGERRYDFSPGLWTPHCPG